MSVIYIIDLENLQDEYAAALDFIKALEGKESGSGEDRKKAVKRAAKQLSISVGEMKNQFSARYLEEPISISERGNTDSKIVQNRRRFFGDTPAPQGAAPIRYHIRVHFPQEGSLESLSGEALIRLQYLAMFLKQASQYILSLQKRGERERKESREELDRLLKKRLTVFIVPLTGAEYPFADENGRIDYSTYAYVSRHLRLLSKSYTGVIYGLDESMGNPKVTSLDFRRNRKCRTHFPLLLIDGDQYEKIFVSAVDSMLEELFSLGKNRRFRNSRDEDPKAALFDFIAETDVYRLWDVAGEEGCTAVFRFLKERRGMTLMELSLFVFMLAGKGNRADLDAWERECRNIWHFARELSQGLRQVAQNSIQHTEEKACFLSFYFHERREGEGPVDFIHRLSQSYPHTYFPPSVGEGALEIFVSDLNEKEDMIDNFVSNLEYEWSSQATGDREEGLEGHLKLMECRDRLAVRNFFSDYALEDEREAWMEFRREDLIAHIGLSQFAQTAQKCRASFRVLSSKRSLLADERNFYYHSYHRGGQKAASGKSDFASRHVIPGMQFSMLIPIQAWEEEPSLGLGQLRQEKHVAENYASFAAFLDYEEKRVSITLRENGSRTQTKPRELLDARKKYREVQKWRRYWREKLEDHERLIGKAAEKNKKYIVNYDFEEVVKSAYFQDEDRVEVFLKGLLSGLDYVKGRDAYFLVALTNLPLGIAESLQRICVQISVKLFPENLQLCFYEKDLKNGKKMILLGEDFSQAIYNSYVLSMEHGIPGFDREDCEKALELREMLLQEEVPAGPDGEGKMWGACPFDVILHCVKRESFFERQLKDMAEGSLDEELVGYKLNNTHMRLGSKVHIESFYEMSFLFYRTTIANRLALHILRQIQRETTREKIDLRRDPVLFYGYASYSKAILTSISEILREYRRQNREGSNVSQENLVAFASFQHNLMLESEETQMYYDLPLLGFPGKVDRENHLLLEEVVKVVQIVPISSTLTTFDKMWKRFSGSLAGASKSRAHLAGNYTAFWVVDEKGDLQSGKPSALESKYWVEIHPEHRIETRLTALKAAGNAYIQYFIRSGVAWHDPLDCKLCYPDYVIEEVPLVETDPTSTVPAQQIRYRGNQTVPAKARPQEEYRRFRELLGCVSYDHISRRQNHYQFYVDTQRYFYKVKELVRKWLESQEKKSTGEGREPILNIIFSPEHNTNVGFVQYVNTYYFNGLAEIVSINVDKQFRSNFICEHAALKQIISELHRDMRAAGPLPVRFYFVDDTVITGDTIKKANGLLHSLVPADEYPVNLFSKIFVLIDRLSDTTKQMYIDNPEENFLSFLHVDVSNVRTYGDSCIGCKLEQDARRMYKRSATRNMAFYWSGKLEDYRKKAYDNREDMEGIEKEKSYRRLLFAHVLQNVIVKQRNCYELGAAYDVMLNLSLWLLGERDFPEADSYGFGDFLDGMRSMTGVKALLKTMCRPFFTYDFKIKRQTYTFFIYLTEWLLGEKRAAILPPDLAENPYISFLEQKRRCAKTEVLARAIREKLREEGKSELEFLRDVLLEGLTDMNSTYAMRLQTMRRLYTYLEDRRHAFVEEERKGFWKSYEIFLHRLASGNADEARELWLEYLYVAGMEYGQLQESFQVGSSFVYEPRFLYESITGKKSAGLEDKYFYQFCNNLFLQNTGISFDGLEEQVTNRSERKPTDGAYLKACWEELRRLDLLQDSFRKKTPFKSYETGAEERLFEQLKAKPDGMTGQSVDEWYESFLDCIVGVLTEKYGIEKQKINIAMLTEIKADRWNTERIQLLEIVKKSIRYDKLGNSETCYGMKERIVRALEAEELFDLKENGYTMHWDAFVGGVNRPYVIAFFDAPQKQETEIYKRSLARVYLYISIAEPKEAERTEFTLRLILRDVMMYRNRILRFMKNDFAGEIYASYAHKVGEKNILSHEKAHSHNTTGDDQITLEIFRKMTAFGKGSDYNVLERQQAAEWLLLRNYTNGQIAKIFNRGFHEESKKGEPLSDIPMYVPADSKENDDIFKQKLVHFSDLNLKECGEAQDRRFELLREIIDIRYEEDLNQAAFIQGERGEYYNLEYFRCILTDIMFSAVKYESDQPDYLLRVDRFLDVKRLLEKEAVSWNPEDPLMARLKERLERSCCSIEIYREPSPTPGVDYLVICNRVERLGRRLSNWEEKNETIMHRIKDPLDYADGHMSLIAIKRYIENLDVSRNLECVFRYIPPRPELGERGELYFENRLPVLKGETARL